MKPVLRQIANLWTLMGHPSRDAEWTLDGTKVATHPAAPAPTIT